MTLLTTLLFACGAPPPPPVPSPIPTDVFDVVRDLGGPGQERLGLVSVTRSPPWTMTAVATEGEVVDLVASMNSLAFVTSAGGSEVPRENNDFFRVLRHGWLASTHGLALAVPAEGPVERYDAVQMVAGAPTALGAMEVDGADYLRVLEGPIPSWVRDANVPDGDGVDAAPPPGESGRGHWSASVTRGTEVFDILQRNRLMRAEILLLPPGTPPPLALTRATEVDAWVPGALTQVTQPGAVWAASGSPGGPLGITVRAYQGVPPVMSALTAHAASAANPGRTPGPSGTLGIGGRTSMVASWSAGQGPSATHGLDVFWPTRDVAELGTDGWWIELVVPGGPETPDPAKIAAHPDLAWVLASLQPR